FAAGGESFVKYNFVKSRARRFSGQFSNRGRNAARRNRQRQRGNPDLQKFSSARHWIGSYLGEDRKRVEVCTLKLKCQAESVFCGRRIGDRRIVPPQLRATLSATRVGSGV